MKFNREKTILDNFMDLSKIIRNNNTIKARCNSSHIEDYNEAVIILNKFFEDVLECEIMHYHAEKIIIKFKKNITKKSK